VGGSGVDGENHRKARGAGGRRSCRFSEIFENGPSCLNRIREFILKPRRGWKNDFVKFEFENGIGF